MDNDLKCEVWDTVREQYIRNITFNRFTHLFLSDDLLHCCRTQYCIMFHVIS